MNMDYALQERSLALQIKILPKLDNEMLRSGTASLEKVIADKAKYIQELTTILKIFQL